MIAEVVIGQIYGVDIVLRANAGNEPRQMKYTLEGFEAAEDKIFNSKHGLLSEDIFIRPLLKKLIIHDSAS